MRVIFVGGPGRSGTSYTAARLGAHPEVCTFPDVELKFLTEKGGLLDLYHTAVEHYSPNRAGVALEQFRRLFLALVGGSYGQPALKEFAAAARWEAVLSAFTAALLTNGHMRPMSHYRFVSTARDLLAGVADLCAAATDTDSRPLAFLEKTPHSLIEIRFLNDLAVDAAFIHVMRDPRSIARSLQAMRWAPDRLESCCEWVSSYCEAFERAKVQAAESRIELKHIQIEWLAANKAWAAEDICSSLGLSNRVDLFKDADLATLNRWARTTPTEEMQVLNGALSHWVKRHSYDSDVVGVPQDAEAVL